MAKKKKKSAFKKLQDNVAKGYEKKGMSKAKAEAIGGGVAYKQGVKKLGKKKMTQKAAAGRKAASKRRKKK